MNKIEPINAKELYESYPKALAEMEKYFTQMEELDMEGNNVREFAEVAIMYAPRFLYDFFDSKGIKVAVIPHTDTDDMWIYYNSMEHHSNTAASRHEAEQKAFVQAFKTLENQL